MKKTILIYGLIGGVISTLGFVYSSITGHMDMTNGMIIGFASMFVAFSLIFVAIKSYRDKQAGGVVSFGNAFKMGVLMSLITSSIYVIVWLVALYNFFPDFAQHYADMQLEDMRQAGESIEKINLQIAENEKMVEAYKNPIVVILYTYMEILPIGLLFSLIAAAILRKKSKNNTDELRSWLESQE